MNAATTVLVPDQDTAQPLKRLGAEVHRIGGNLNQTSRACNEARLSGHRIPYTERTHAEVCAAIDVMIQGVGQISQMARGQRGQLDVAVATAFRTKGEPSEGS